MKPDDLVGLTEIARMLGVHNSAVSNWQTRDVGFPEPWGRWYCGPLFLRSEIEAWHADRIAARRAKAQERVDAAQRILDSLPS